MLCCIRAHEQTESCSIGNSILRLSLVLYVCLLLCVQCRLISTSPEVYLSSLILMEHCLNALELVHIQL